MLALAILGVYAVGSMTYKAVKRKKMQRKIKKERLANEGIHGEEPNNGDSDTELETHEVHVDERPKLKRKFIRSTKFSQ